jgi:hypothetical protein
VAKKEAAKQAKAGLSLLDGAGKGSEKSKKSSKKAKEPKSMAGASEQEMQANFQADLMKAKEATENAKGMMPAADNKMFAFYANLLSVEAKYAWNKIVEEQQKATRMLIFKVSRRKAQGECHVSCLTIA